MTSILMFLVGFLVGGVTALWAAHRLRQHWRAKARARRPLGEGEDGETDPDLILRRCGPVCQECIREGWPRELCGWLL